MRPSHLCIAAALLALSLSGVRAQSLSPTDRLHAIYQRLREDPAQRVEEEGALYWLVNDRHERLTTRKELRDRAVYVMRITVAGDAWNVQVRNADNVVLMDGACLDPEGQVLHGDVHFSDENGQLRAEGRYERGSRVGVWRRFTDAGVQLPDKTYYAEDWEALQIRVGMASMSTDLGETTAGKSE